MTSSQNSSQSSDSSSSQASADTNMDLEVFGELKSLMEDDLGDFLATFIADTQRRVDSIFGATDRADFVTAGEIAHSLKGSALNVGASGLARRCYTVEHALKSSAATRVSEAQSEVLEMLNNTWQSTKAFMEQELRAGL